MNYTKGPWEIRETLHGDFDIDTSSAEPRLGYIGWEGLATFYGSDDNRRVGREVARANATLAAAAPDLLKALLAIADETVRTDGAFAAIAIKRFRVIARAAIEKATKP